MNNRMDDAPPRVGIVVLNWNGWRDTIACVESLRTLDYPAASVYVVDNASVDGSEWRLRAWDPSLTVIQSGANLGWAGGCNVGIRAALAAGCAHVYLVNNDAVVRPDTLSRLVAAASRARAAAALGSQVISLADPEHAEFAGTVIDAASGHPRQLHGRIVADGETAEAVPTAAVKGCSMLLTGDALQRVGLFSEDFFLNYDETDWCFRARAAGLVNYFVPGSMVAHRGAVSFQGTTSPLYRYFITRNRLLFARRHLDSRGRRSAWRGGIWEIKNALLLSQSERLTLRQRGLLVLAICLALRDYCLGRLGDCPPLVRKMTRWYAAAAP